MTLVANYNPLQDAYGGPNYFTLDPDAVYQIHLDNNGDAMEDVTFQFRPSINVKNLAVDAGGVMVAVPLINIGQIGPGAADTAALNREETYTVNIIRGDRRSGSSFPITNTAGGSATFRKPVDNIGNNRCRRTRPMRATTSTTSPSPAAATGACSSASARIPLSSTSARRSTCHVTNPLGAENAEKDDLADKTSPRSSSGSNLLHRLCGTAGRRRLDDGKPRSRRDAGWIDPRCAGGMPGRDARLAAPHRLVGNHVGPGSELPGLGAEQPSEPPRRSGEHGAGAARSGRHAGVAPRRAARQRSGHRPEGQGPLQIGQADTGFGAGGRRDETDAARAARDPLRRRRRARAESTARTEPVEGKHQGNGRAVLHERSERDGQTGVGLDRPERRAERSACVEACLRDWLAHRNRPRFGERRGSTAAEDASHAEAKHRQPVRTRTHRAGRRGRAGGPASAGRQ